MNYTPTRSSNNVTVVLRFDRGDSPLSQMAAIAM